MVLHVHRVKLVESEIPCSAYTNCWINLSLSPSYSCFFEIGFGYLAQTGLKLIIFLPQPLECWDQRHAHLCKAGSDMLAERIPDLLGLQNIVMIIHKCMEAILGISL
jgi:hypothetical protein